MNPFTPTSFDSIIGKGMAITGGSMSIPQGTGAVIDGTFHGTSICDEGNSPSTSIFGRIREIGTPSTSTLTVNGSADITDEVQVHNVTVTGTLTAKRIVCNGMLAVKAGAKITADEVCYRSLTIENGAIVLARMVHLDQEDYKNQPE